MNLRSTVIQERAFTNLVLTPPALWSRSICNRFAERIQTLLSS